MSWAAASICAIPRSWQFFVDDSIAYGAHILDMLNHVKPADPRNADIVLPEDRED